MYEFRDFSHRYPFPDERVANNTNGVQYQCDRCAVRGQIQHGEVIRCWYCEKSDKLRTNTDLKIGGTSAARMSPRGEADNTGFNDDT